MKYWKRSTGKGRHNYCLTQYGFGSISKRNRWTNEPHEHNRERARYARQHGLTGS